MAMVQSPSTKIFYSSVGYVLENAYMATTKGREVEYEQHFLTPVTSMDFSNNKL